MRGSPWLVAPLALIAASACSRADAPSVSGAWVRLAAVPGRPAAAYFTVKGGPADWTLVRVSTPAAGRAELHETMQMSQGSMRGMAMQPIGQVAVPAATGITFAPGGKHVMLFDVKPGVKPGDKVPFEFGFANGRTLGAQALVVAAGDPPPQ